MFSAGDVVAAEVQIGEDGKKSSRLALVLYEEFNNVVVAGITSNPYAKGIQLTKKDGAPRDGVIKLNYVFTVSKETLSRPLFRLDGAKKKQIFGELLKLLSGLQE